MEAVGIIKINRLIRILNRQDNGVSRTHRVCTAECVVKRKIMFAVLRLVLIIPDILNRRKDSCMECQRFLILGNHVIAQCDILLLGQS